MLLLVVAAVLVPILSGYAVLYIVRCYAIVLTQSSSGVDRLRWPKDTYHDWFGDAWLVLLVLLVLVTLTAIVALPLMLITQERWQAFAVGGVALLFVWLAFPIAICTAHHPTLIVELPRRFFMMLRVLGMTTPLAAAAGFGVGLTIVGNMAGPYLVALVGAPAILIHARAWGRFVWLALNERPRRRRKSKKPDFEPELETAIRAAQPTAEATLVEEGDYELEASDWTPESGNLAEHYEIERERERWNRLRAREERVDPLGRSKPPTPWTALAPSKIFGILLQSETAAAGICIALGLGLLSTCAFVIIVSASAQ
jgi:hypothetical protein